MGEEGEKGEGRRLVGELPETESLGTELSGCRLASQERQAPGSGL